MKRLNPIIIIIILISQTLYPSSQYNNFFTENYPQDFYESLDIILNTTSPDELYTLLSLPLHHHNPDSFKPLPITHSQPTPNNHPSPISIATTISLILTTSILLLIVSSHLNFPPPVLPPALPLPHIPAPGQAF